MLMCVDNKSRESFSVLVPAHIYFCFFVHVKSDACEYHGAVLDGM
jgi:hypothetical protein